ncbi:MAG TPA: DoxX family protein [Acidobacteriaceae bacterium]|nr:DoxX family protein [Acidobacteriaceae bacterium]
MLQQTMNPSGMTSAAREVPSGQRWTGRVIAGLIAAFMLLDAAMKFLRPPQVAAAFVRSGWPLELSVPLGVILLTCTVLYLIPRTAVLGALLLTGYLGGAVASNMRLQTPLFSQTLFPVYFGMLLWLALWLREPRLRELIPLRGTRKRD